MGKFGETYNRLVTELAIAPAVLPAVQAVGGVAGRAAITRGLAALGGGLATVMNIKNDQKAKPKPKNGKANVGEPLVKDLPGVKGPIVQSKFNEYYKHVMGDRVDEAGPLLLAAPWVAPAALTALGASAALLSDPKLASNIGRAVLQTTDKAAAGVSDFVSSLGKDTAQKTPITGLDLTTGKAPTPVTTTTPAAAPVPTTTTTPVIAPAPTTTTTPAAVATPSSTTTPDINIGAAIAPIAGTAALARAIPLSRSIAQSRTKTKTGSGGLPDLNVPSNKELPGVKGPIVQNKFYI